MICPHCGGNYTTKNGSYKGKDKERIQRYSCKVCNRSFSVPEYSDVTEKSFLTTDARADRILQFKFDDTIRVYGATDIHHGANEHHWEMFDEFIDTVAKDENGYWFINGDAVEFIPPNYHISQRGQCMEPDEQHLTFIKRIDPIKEKLLFVRGGNHDMIRSIKLLGFDVAHILAETMGKPYCKLPGYTKITISNRDWYLVSGHGRSGAKNGDLELTKLAAVYSAGDVFYLGHNHQLYAKPVDSLKPEDNEERLHRRWYCRGGSFLKYADYARYSMFPIIRTGWVVMEFGKDKIRSWTN
jgi:predicted phosphodiesterase